MMKVQEYDNYQLCYSPAICLSRPHINMFHFKYKTGVFAFSYLKIARYIIPPRFTSILQLKLFHFTNIVKKSLYLEYFKYSTGSLSESSHDLLKLTRVNSRTSLAKSLSPRTIPHPHEGSETFTFSQSILYHLIKASITKLN